VSLSLVAEALLALCFINVRPQNDFDPTTGRPIQNKTEHPIVPLMKSCRSWLDWDLERERIRDETNKGNLSGVGDACNSNIAPCAITALCHMTLLKQCTTSLVEIDEATVGSAYVPGSKRKSGHELDESSTTAQFYIDIFDDKNVAKADTIRAAAAQAVVCICCAADRNDEANTEPLGLLLSLEFMLDRILGELVTLVLLHLPLSFTSLCITNCFVMIFLSRRIDHFTGTSPYACCTHDGRVHRKDLLIAKGWELLGTGETVCTRSTLYKRSIRFKFWWR
jgi:hypothetical protein